MLHLMFIIAGVSYCSGRSRYNHGSRRSHILVSGCLSYEATYSLSTPEAEMLYLMLRETQTGLGISWFCKRLTCT